MIYKKNIFYFITLFFFIGLSIQAKFIIPEKPKKIYPVNDYSNILTYYQIIQLNKKLITYHKKQSIAIVISIIDSINQEDISMIATKWGTKWQIGQKQESNGIFILLVRKDKKITIQTGYGVEVYLTDFLCKKIINQIIPSLKQEKYYFAINNIINFIVNNIKYTKQIQHKKEDVFNKIIFYLFLLVLLLILIYIYFNKTQNLIFCEEDIILPKMRQDNYDKNTYKDDQFDGFGEGGEFGGGGASGNW